jgi:hypothetical protein
MKQERFEELVHTLGTTQQRVVPALSIWFSPRKTAAYVAAWGATGAAVLLYAVYGFTHALSAIAVTGFDAQKVFGEESATLHDLIAPLLYGVGTAIGGVLYAFLAVGVIHVTARFILGGAGGYGHALIVMAWALVPVIAGRLLTVALGLVRYGPAILEPREPQLVGLLMQLPSILGALWAIAVLVPSLAETYGFGLPRAALSLVLPIVALAALLYGPSLM